MKLIPSAIAILALCVTPLIHAQDDAKRAAAAEQLLKVTHVDELMAKQKENVKRMMASLLPKDLSPDALKRVQDAQSAALDAVFQQLTWESLKPDFIHVYSEVFTEQELNDLIAFYKTESGQKFIEKMPELQAKSMELVQKRMVTLMPAVQAAVKDALMKAKAEQSLQTPAK